MKPDNPKEYMISSLKNLLYLIEQDNMILTNINDETIGYPELPLPWRNIHRGRRITLELYYANKETN